MCKKLFVFIIVAFPLATSILLLQASGTVHISLSNMEFILNYTEESKLIGYAFTIVLLTANLYAISKNRYFEAMIGSLYCASSLLCLFAGDFLSMFIALECMMVFASILIFIGGNKNSSQAAKQYFLIHLFSGSLILIGVSYIIVNTGSIELRLLTSDLVGLKYPMMYVFILIGCLINVASIPFQDWMVNCYPESSSSGLLYLITLTSKVSIMILIKLFNGLWLLKFLGVLMILYGGLYAIIETNLRRLICYLTISQLGFMLVSIGTNSEYTVFAVVAFLFVHILYKALFTLYIAILLDHGHIKYCSEIRGIKPNKQPLLFCALLFSVLTTISLPPLASYTTKIAATANIDNNFIYYVISFLKLLTCVSLFSIAHKHRFWSGNFSPTLNIITKLCLYILIFTTLVTNLYLSEILIIVWPSYPVQILTTEVSNLLTQGIIIIIGIMLTFILRTVPRRSTKRINFSLFAALEWLCCKLQVPCSLYLALSCSLSSPMQLMKQSVQGLNVVISRRVQLLHNQKASLAIVIIVLIGLTVVLGKQLIVN